MSENRKLTDSEMALMKAQQEAWGFLGCDSCGKLGSLNFWYITVDMHSMERPDRMLCSDCCNGAMRMIQDINFPGLREKLESTQSTQEKADD